VFVTGVGDSAALISTECRQTDMLIQSGHSAYKESSGFLLSSQRLTHDQARTEARVRSIEKARFGAYWLEPHGTLTAHRSLGSDSLE
jgi:hypothetical protein